MPNTCRADKLAAIAARGKKGNTCRADKLAALAKKAAKAERLAARLKGKPAA